MNDGILDEKVKAFGSDAKVSNCIAQNPNGESFGVTVRRFLSDRIAIQWGGSGVFRKATAPLDVCERHRQWVGKSVLHVY